MGLACDATTLTCICTPASSAISSTTSICTARLYGDSCSTVSQCDSGAYTDLLSNGGGPTCSSSTCDCATGFDKVARLKWDASTQTSSTVNACLKTATYTKSLTEGSSCHLNPHESSTSGAQVCDTSLTCIRCREDTHSSGLGFCRFSSQSMYF